MRRGGDRFAGVPIGAAVRQSCWSVLDQIVYPHRHSGADIDGDVERLLLAAIDSSRTPARTDGLAATASVLDRRLRAAIAYMREHANEIISAEDVAARVGLSRGHFFALFRDQLKTTPHVFWSAVRVEEAVRRMVQEDEP